MRLGFVGTGTMGALMAGCLIEAGHELTVYDIRAAATTALVQRGARGAGGPADVARLSEVVFTSLPGPSEVEQAVLDSSTGILTGLAAGGGYIDMTTNAPVAARRIAEACRARGVAMLDAPVSGRPPAMTVMVGGDASVFATHRFSPNIGLSWRRWPATSSMSAKLVPAVSPSSSRNIWATPIS